MTSREHDGYSGPLLETMNLGLEYLWPEEIAVPARTFPSHHYRFSLEDTNMNKKHPTEDLWCTDEFIFIKISVGCYMASNFELIELEYNY